MTHRRHHQPDHDEDREILEVEKAILRRDDEILHELRHDANRITHFTDIKETSMPVPLAAGQTATFSTTPIPDGTAPDASKITWSSSDTTNAPIVVNPNDASGLSAQVTFPDSVTAGLTFIVSINYQNTDGTFASQANSFTTVAPPPADVSGFTDIVQSA